MNVDVVGLAEVENALKGMGRKLATREAGNALRAGARIIRDEARKNAPVLSGALKKSLIVRTGRSRGDWKNVIVGVGKKWFVGDQFYAAFLEFGWKHGSRKRGDARKQIPGRHYVESAYKTQRQRALRAVTDYLVAAIRRSWK